MSYILSAEQLEAINNFDFDLSGFDLSSINVGLNIGSLGESISNLKYDLSLAGQRAKYAKEANEINDLNLGETLNDGNASDDFGKSDYLKMAEALENIDEERLIEVTKKIKEQNKELGRLPTQEEVQSLFDEYDENVIKSNTPITTSDKATNKTQLYILLGVGLLVSVGLYIKLKK